MTAPTPPPARAARTTSAVILVGATLVLGVLTLIGEWAQTPTGPLILDCAVLGVSVALMPVLSRSRLLGAALQAILAALSPAGTPGSTIATINVAWRERFWPAAALAAAGVAAHLLRWIWRPYPGLTFGWWLVLVVAVHAALFGWGAQARVRQRLIASLAERARRAETEQARRVTEARAQERTLIAREMHDVLAHRLSLLATYAGAMEYRPDAPVEQRTQAAGVIRSGVHEALEELREVIAVLRDEPVDQAGDGIRPQPTLGDLPALVTECSAAGMHVTVTDETSGAPPSTIGRAAYRMVQEALTNARKHAPGAPVSIEVAGSTVQGELTVRVRNPLIADGGAHLPGSGTGLVGLAERARLVGGRLEHRAGPDDFEVVARLPWTG
ncbi:MAG TPA: histidine kinase [Candidatus Ruania gallistercoris]|uniref:histidine kinase n=1 Tax=Candidatus Ruania gallistercoris TaxID=2838746 RepID=A0A9D2J3Q6_9MICO|nr:histidine kinase [Candidatus Ruania gallistercoris]